VIAGQAPQIHGYDLVHRLRLSIRLWVEHGSELQLDTDQGEQFLPKVVGEDWVPVTNNGAQDAVESNHYVEEDLGHSRRCIWMFERQEVSRFGKWVHHREDDRFPLDLGQPFHEFDCNVSPHCCRNIQGLQGTRRVELFRFVALAHLTFMDIPG
jgi:hypothetical protein